MLFILGILALRLFCLFAHYGDTSSQNFIGFSTRAKQAILKVIKQYAAAHSLRHSSSKQTMWSRPFEHTFTQWLKFDAPWQTTHTALMVKHFPFSMVEILKSVISKCLPLDSNDCYWYCYCISDWKCLPFIQICWLDFSYLPQSNSSKRAAKHTLTLLFTLFCNLRGFKDLLII